MDGERQSGKYNAASKQQPRHHATKATPVAPISAKLRPEPAIFPRYTAGMSDDDPLKQALRGPALSRRDLRAMRTRAQALSPVRILIQVLLVPVVTLGVTVSIYTRTSPYERTDALRHLAAMAGCDTAQAMNLAPAFEGEIGYHARNDPDGDGVACDAVVVALAQPVMPEFTAPSASYADVDSGAREMPATNTITGAKFIKP